MQMFLTEYEEIPFEALTYLAGECNYGGRVTDDKDRRLLMSLLDVFYNERVLTDPDGEYRMPQNLEHGAVQRHIAALPARARPEVFGLHDNADISRDNQETAALLAGCLATQRAGGGAGAAAGGGEAAAAELTRALLARLPGDFDVAAAAAAYPVLYLNSMNTVLKQELIRYNRLVSVVRSSLRGVYLAARGLAVLSAELEACAAALVRGAVPQLWAARSYPSMKPLGSYVTDLLARYAARHVHTVAVPSCTPLGTCTRWPCPAVGRALLPLHEAAGLLRDGPAGQVRRSARAHGGRAQLWAARSYPSMKPLGSYVTDLLARYAARHVHTVRRSARAHGGRAQLWAARSYPSMKPLGSYVTDLLARYAARHVHTVAVPSCTPLGTCTRWPCPAVGRALLPLHEAAGLLRDGPAGQVRRSARAHGGRAQLWAARSYPSMKPLGSYVTDLLARYAARHVHTVAVPSCGPRAPTPPSSHSVMPKNTL
ncbi:hypothetical protein ACJJTC_008703 [Scirpophaga incertulas]